MTEKPNKQKVKHVSDQQKVYTTVNDRPVCSEATAHNLLYRITANTIFVFLHPEVDHVDLCCNMDISSLEV